MVSNTSHPFPSDELLKSIQRKNVSSSLNQIKRMLGNMPSSEIAHSLESLPPKERKLLWSMIEIEDEAGCDTDSGEKSVGAAVIAG